MSEEEWRPVVGWEGLYEVSSHGRVRGLDRMVATRDGSRFARGQEIKPYTDVGGYPVVTLSHNGKTRNRKISRLVAEAFIPNPENHRNVLHRDDVKVNNTPSNLYWGSLKQNAQDALRNGVNARAARTHCRKGHEYTDENTKYRPDRPASRICIECDRELESNRTRRRWETPPPQHGTVSAYVSHKCRCDECKSVYAAYQKVKRSRRVES